MLKSTPPVSQTLFTQHIIIHITLLPSADTGDCSDGVTVTLNGLADIPPTSVNVTIINSVASEPINCICVNLTLIFDESIIIPVALVREPATTTGASDDGTFKLILNTSSPSTMLSFLTATLTVVLVAPAGIIAVMVIVLKSLPLMRKHYNMNKIKLATKLFAVSSEKLILTEIALFIMPPVIIIVIDILLSFSVPLKLSDAN